MACGHEVKVTTLPEAIERVVAGSEGAESGGGMGVT